MKEGAPEEVDGIDVTNVPEKVQYAFLDHAREANGVITDTIRDPRSVERDREGELAATRFIVENNPDGIDTHAARAEMERALKKGIEEKLG